MVNNSECFEATQDVYVSIVPYGILIKNTTINLRTREGVIRHKGLAHLYDTTRHIVLFCFIHTVCTLIRV